MIWLRSLLAFIAGFAAMAVAVMVLTAGLAPVFAPGNVATPLWLVVNLAYSLAAAALGGWVAAHLAPRARFEHGAAVAVFVVASYFLGGMQPQPGQPDWYPHVITAIAVAGLLAGARYRAQRG